jgi:phosphatidylserine/phosphatidylglycerophosphate/cardiolipin synthase-like enzyme
MTRRRRLLYALCLALAASSQPAAADVSTLKQDATLQAAFSPWDDIEALLVDAIAHARQQVLLQAYLLTSKPIAAALLQAHRRGVIVQILADAQQLEKGESRVPELASAGVAVWLETAYQNAHNKIIIIDADQPDATVITGSYNFTWTAQHKNAENVLIVRGDITLARRYAANWERHRRDARPYGEK